jgi:hypothetical protein
MLKKITFLFFLLIIIHFLYKRLVKKGLRGISPLLCFYQLLIASYLCLKAMKAIMPPIITQTYVIGTIPSIATIVALALTEAVAIAAVITGNILSPTTAPITTNNSSLSCIKSKPSQ